MLGELTEYQKEDVLRSERIGRIGVHDGTLPYVVPVTYAYAGGVVYGHTSEVTKLQLACDHPRVCFEVDHLDGASNWRSVMAHGLFERLRGEDARQAMSVLVRRLEPLITPSHLPVGPGGGVDVDRVDAMVWRIVLMGGGMGRFERR